MYLKFVEAKKLRNYLIKIQSDGDFLNSFYWEKKKKILEKNAFYHEKKLRYIFKLAKNWQRENSYEKNH